MPPPHNRPSSSRLSTATTPAHVKSRQFSHLNSQLAQLQAHLADLDNHVRITAIQAEAMKRLGAQHASMYFCFYGWANTRFMAVTRAIGDPIDAEEFVGQES
jgi:DASH complex subunit Hsk3 like